MYSKFLLGFLLVAFNFAFSQNGFENGYYVDSEGLKVECLLKMSDVNNINSNKSVIQFKQLSDNEQQTIALEKVREIGIANDLKLVKYTLPIDKTVNGLNNDDGNTNFQMETVFLNVLLEGTASLFLYNNGQNEFFYSVNDQLPIQLIHRKYVSDGFVKENNSFRQELMAKLRCPDDVPQKFLNLKYTLLDLAAIIESYNQCQNTETKKFNNDRIERGKITYGFFVGGYSSNYTMIKIEPNPDPYNSLGYGFGGELGFLSASNSWQFFFRTELESMKANFTTERGTTTKIVEEYELKTMAVNLSIGYRYYINPAAKNKVFAEAAVAMNFPFDNIDSKTFEVEPTQTNLFSSTKLATSPNIFINLGLGCKIGDHYALSLRYDFPRTVANKAFSGLILQYDRIGINLHYQF